MSGAWIGWAVAVITGAGASTGLYMALRPYRRVASMRYLLPVLVAVWALLPWRIAEDSGHFAPAFIVLLFRGLFEPEGEPAAVAAGLLLATAIVQVLYFVVVGVAFALRRARADSPN
ncbi:MAG: hypothetical protein OXH52_06165 [Gammaproteobacteria bacterium]|nr:hypothetical protein [Gammaproteobacteria bacterium]